MHLHSMVSRSLRTGLTGEDTSRLAAVGFDPADLGGDEVPLVRIRDRAMLHMPSCGVVAGRRGLHEVVVTPATLARFNLHQVCTQWAMSAVPNRTRLANALHVAHWYAAVAELEQRDTAAPARLWQLREYVRGGEFAAALEAAEADRDLPTVLLRRLSALEQRWSGVDPGTRLRPFVAAMISMPLASAALLDLPLHRRGVLATTCWKRWVSAVRNEGSLDQARAAAVHAGQEEGVSVDAAVDVWQAHVEELCTVAAAQGEVIVAISRTADCADAVDNLLAVFTHCSARSGDRVVIRCPAVAAHWLYTTAHLDAAIAVATDRDTPDVLESLAAMWDPHCGAELADAAQALAVARML